MSKFLEDVVKKFETEGTDLEQTVKHLQIAAEKGRSVEAMEQLATKTAEGLEATQKTLNTLVELEKSRGEAEVFAATEEEAIDRFKKLDVNSDGYKALQTELASRVGAHNAYLMEPTVDGLTKFLHKPLNVKSDKYEDEKAGRHAMDLLMIFTAINGGVKGMGASGDAVIVQGSVVRRGIDLLSKSNLNGVEFIQKFATGGALDSLTAGEGLEWIPTQVLSDELIRDIWLDTNVAGLFRKRQMNAPTLTLPRKKDFSTPFLFSEAQAVSDYLRTSPPLSSNFTTDNVTWTAKKSGILTFTSAELIADSVVAILEEIYADLRQAYANALDDVAINGCRDLTTLDNAGTDGNKLWANSVVNTFPQSNTGAADMRYMANGIRKNAQIVNKAIVQADANYSSDGTSTGRKAMLTVRGKMGKYGLANIDKLHWIMSGGAYVQALAFKEVVSVMGYGPDSPLKTGALYQLDGIDIRFNPKVYDNLNENGVFNNVTTSKTEAILVHTDAYAWGERMGMTVESEYHMIPQQTAIMASMRLDFQKQMFLDRPTEGVLVNINN